MFWEKSKQIHLNPSRPSHGRREKNNLNFYFHTFLWCLKRFCEGLKGLIFLNINFLNAQDGKGYGWCLKCTFCYHVYFKDSVGVELKMWIYYNSFLNRSYIPGRKMCLKSAMKKCGEYPSTFLQPVFVDLIRRNYFSSGN